MPKDSKTASKQNSSHDDDDCHHEKPCNKCKKSCDDSCEKSCGPKCVKDCCIVKCPEFSPEEIVCQFADAVVQVSAEFILLGSEGPELDCGCVRRLQRRTGKEVESHLDIEHDRECAVSNNVPTGETPVRANIRKDVILNGNGFFIKGHYIVTSAQILLMPPSLTSLVNRYPYYNQQVLTQEVEGTGCDAVTGITGTRILDQMMRASRVLVSVFNVNGKGHSFVYEADIVGIDGAGDIAVLRINYKKPWNMCNPCVEECHPIVKFGSSRATKDGEKAYLIGDYISDTALRTNVGAAGAISEGLVSDHRFVDYTGYIFAEQVLVSAKAYSFSSGLPILNAQGEVIGMQVADVSGNNSANSVYEGYGYVSGPSEFFMRRVVSTIIKGSCSRDSNAHLQLICDPAGDYFRYLKGYLGLAYNLVVGTTYDVTTDYTSGEAAQGTSGHFTVPRIRLSCNGEFLNSPSCKELIGIQVQGIAGLNRDCANDVCNGLVYVPGGSGEAVAPLVAELPASSLLGRLQPGDIITHINGVPLGDIDHQVAPALITWRLLEGDTVELCYRRGGNATNSEDNGDTENFDNLLTVNACVLDYPQVMDYPWAMIDKFPYLPDDGWYFPLTQRQSIQYPQLDNELYFGPAI